MKLVATQPNGDLLLVCTPNEYRALNILQNAATSKIALWKPMLYPMDDLHPLNADEQKLLEAIYQWIDTKDLANHLQEIAGEINKLLGEGVE